MELDDLQAVHALLTGKPRPQSWSERRQRIDEVGSDSPVAEDIVLETVDMDGVPGEWSMAPGSNAQRVLLYFHGGGYCSGSIRSHRAMVTEAGRAGALRTLAVEYRLAPEHPFPAALEDGLTAWNFLQRHGISPRSIALGGDSAGGGLAVALMNSIREAGGELPACTWLVSPWTDLTMSGCTLASKAAVDPLIHKDYLEELASAYVPPGVDRKDARCSVLFANLENLPPILIQVGSAETLLDDAARFSEKAGAQNVSVTLEIWPHMIHVWHLWHARLKSGRRALAKAGAFIRQRLDEAVT